MIIETKETMYNFNTKYFDLYDQLETEDKASISVIDYVNALLPRTQSLYKDCYGGIWFFRRCLKKGEKIRKYITGISIEKWK